MKRRGGAASGKQGLVVPAKRGLKIPSPFFLLNDQAIGNQIGGPIILHLSETNREPMHFHTGQRPTPLSGITPSPCDHPTRHQSITLLQGGRGLTGPSPRVGS